MSDLDSLLAALGALHPRRIDLSLGRILRLLDRLDRPQERVPPVIHVAGTNGKGSTIAFLRAARRGQYREESSRQPAMIGGVNANQQKMSGAATS